jgi:two-component sensor histidine kinase
LDFKKEQLAKQLGWVLYFVWKILMRNPELESVFTSIPNNRFSWKRIPSKKEIHEVYTLAANKNITVTEIQKEIKNNLAVLKSNVEY